MVPENLDGELLLESTNLIIVTFISLCFNTVLGKEALDKYLANK